MKVSKLIFDLIALQQKHGDIRVDIGFWGGQANVTKVQYLDSWVHQDEDGEIESDVECILIDTE